MTSPITGQGQPRVIKNFVELGSVMLHAKDFGLWKRLLKVLAMYGH